MRKRITPNPLFYGDFLNFILMRGANNRKQPRKTISIVLRIMVYNCNQPVSCKLVLCITHVLVVYHLVLSDVVFRPHIKRVTMDILQETYCQPPHAFGSKFVLFFLLSSSPIGGLLVNNIYLVPGSWIHLALDSVWWW